MKIKTDINIDHYYRLQALAAQGHKFSFNDFVNHMIWNYIMYCICTDDMVPPPELVVPHNPKAERKNITIDIESYPHMMFKKYCEQRSISMTTCVKILTTIYSYMWELNLCDNFLLDHVKLNNGGDFNRFKRVLY